MGLQAIPSVLSDAKKPRLAQLCAEVGRPGKKQHGRQKENYKEAPLKWSLGEEWGKYIKAKTLRKIE